MPDFANIIVAVPLKQTFTYAVPPHLSGKAAPGQWVVVPFGFRRFTSGIIISLSQNKPSGFKVKSIHKIVYAEPVVSKVMLRFWKWLSGYYMSSVGSILQAAVPGNLYQAIEKARKGKFEKLLKLHPAMNEKKLNEILDGMGRAKKQKSFLLKYLELENYGVIKTLSGVPKKKLIRAIPVATSSIKGLLDKKILIEFERKIIPKKAGHASEKIPGLSSANKRMLNQLEKHFLNNDCVLLQGADFNQDFISIVHLIENHLNKKESVLYLHSNVQSLKNTEKRLFSFFGNKSVSYHAQLKPSQKANIWEKLRKKESRYLVLGVKSALLLPLQNIKFIIIHEEHNPQHKRKESMPFYHTRDASIMLAKMINARVLLYSSTPSSETFSNVLHNKFGCVKSTDDLQQHPTISCIDAHEARRKKLMIGAFTPQAVKEIEIALSQNEQIVVFQNRRGFSNYLFCTNCDFIPNCPHCDISLTYHQRTGKLHCHYCNFFSEYLEKCPNCDHPKMTAKGFGTESIEQELKQLFSAANVSHLDADLSIKEKKNIIALQKNKETDIIVCTQSGIYSLDYQQVQLIIVLNIDQMLNYPDFRADEYGLQFLMKVSQLIPDAKKRLLIQTFQTQSAVIQAMVNNDYDGFLRRQLLSRKEFVYPPFYRLIEIEFKHKDLDIVSNASIIVTQILKEKFGIRVFGPLTPPVGKIRDWYFKKVLLKFEKSISAVERQKAKDFIVSTTETALDDKEFKSVEVSYDVDPV